MTTGGKGPAMELAFAKRLASRVTLASTRATGQRTLPRMRGWRLFLPIGAALLAVGGCASAPVPPPSEEVRASLGRIGIRSGFTSPSGEWNMPAKGGAAGAGRGAAVGALSVLAAPCGGYGCAANILLAPVGAVVGGISGGAMAEPATIVKEAETAIQSAFADLPIPDMLRDRFLHVARVETRHIFAQQDGTAAPDATAERLAGPDTILQINVQGYGTKAAWRPNPPLFLFLDIDMRLLRPADGTVIYSRKVAWLSAGRPIAEWAGSNGDPVREELGRGIQYLAERIVDAVFLLRPFP